MRRTYDDCPFSGSPSGHEPIYNIGVLLDELLDFRFVFYLERYGSAIHRVSKCAAENQLAPINVLSHQSQMRFSVGHPPLDDILDVVI